jgi:hypothetical protein
MISRLEIRPNVMGIIPPGDGQFIHVEPGHFIQNALLADVAASLVKGVNHGARLRLTRGYAGLVLKGQGEREGDGCCYVVAEPQCSFDPVYYSGVARR